MQGRTKKIILFIILLVLVAFGVWYFLYSQNDGPEDDGRNLGNLFPFGEINPGNQNPEIDSQGTIGEENAQETQETGDEEEFEPAGPRLRQISDFPTGGFIPIIRLKREEISDIAINEDGNSTEILRTIEVEDQYIRYSNIKNADIFETKVTPGNLEQGLLVENFVPNAEYAHFNDLGNRVIFQYWNKENNVPESYLAKIEPILFKIEACPFEFTPIKIQDDSEKIIGIHEFLNRNPQTRIARTGTNSPGNETSLASETTLTAIKNFQSLYQIDIDGQIGTATREKMTEICDNQQEKIARTEFDQLDKKYTISGFFLPQNITSISMNPAGDRVFYIQEDNIGVIGIIRNLITETKKTIFESPFKEWTSQWETINSIELTTKPSYDINGFSYNLTADTGRYFKSLKETKGLTTKESPDGTYLLIHESDTNSPKLSIYDRETKRKRPLNIQTHTDKCTWSDNSKHLYCGMPGSLGYGNEYPDIWYQGIETYSDSLWKINAETLQEDLLSDIPREYSKNIDIEMINIDDKSEYLYFIDKKTEFLWSYRLVDF